MVYFKMCARCQKNFNPSSKFTTICNKCNRAGKYNRKKIPPATRERKFANVNLGNIGKFPAKR